MSASYQAIGWLPADTVVTIADLEAMVRKWFPASPVTLRKKTVEALLKDWRIRWTLGDEPHVAEEATEFAEEFAEEPRVAGLAGCRARIEVNCPDLDPDGDFFNDYVFACQAIEDVPGIVLFDPLSCVFI